MGRMEGHITFWTAARASLAKSFMSRNHCRRQARLDNALGPFPNGRPCAHSPPFWSGSLPLPAWADLLPGGKAVFAHQHAGGFVQSAVVGRDIDGVEVVLPDLIVIRVVCRVIFKAPVPEFLVDIGISDDRDFPIDKGT